MPVRQTNAVLRSALAHVLWIGGPPDAGKTTVASILAARHGLQLYSYDSGDVRHHEHLAGMMPEYRRFLDASLDERWVYPSAVELADRALGSFRDRLPLVLADLQSLPADAGIIAEGFGFMPELIAPFLLHAGQAVWLVPTDAFRQASFEARGKGLEGRVSDPDRASYNLSTRDGILASHVRQQARERRFRLIEVDTGQPVAEIAAAVEAHFSAAWTPDGVQV